MSDAMRHLSESERSCVERFLGRLSGAFAESLREIWLFGSFARGDMWSRQAPMNSDIDLLVVTREEVSAKLREELVNDTYPLYLECGRQISPQFWSVSKFEEPPTSVAREFKERVLHEGSRILQAGPQAAA